MVAEDDARWGARALREFGAHRLHAPAGDDGGVQPRRGRRAPWRYRLDLNSGSSSWMFSNRCSSDWASDSVAFAAS